MRTQVLFVVIFLVCAAVSDDSKPTVHDTTSASTNGSLLQKINTKVEGLLSKSSVESGVSRDNSNDKATTPKTKANVEKPSSHSDASDLIGDSMFSRAAYLLTGISVLVLLYFAWKSFSLRKRQTHIHKYGVVASREDLEMTSLGFGSEDEEDDTTHFDIGKHQRS